MIFRFINGLLDGVPMLRAMVEDRTAETITLTNRVVIEIHTASFRVTRGYTLRRGARRRDGVLANRGAAQTRTLRSSAR